MQSSYYNDTTFIGHKKKDNCCPTTDDKISSWV
jgi:hypothetical protein